MFLPPFCSRPFSAFQRFSISAFLLLLSSLSRRQRIRKLRFFIQICPSPASIVMLPLPRIAHANCAMKPKAPSNGLSARANRCLSTAGIPAEKEAVRQALQTGELYPYFRPTLYGKKTHHEVCRWAGLDESFVSPTTPPSTRPPVVENGLSARANHLLFRAGIPAERSAVKHALQTGSLRPGKHPVNYGKQTHAELCHWAGVDPSALHSP